MKLKVGECVYLQKYEIAYLTSELSCLPASIFDELFGGDEENFFFMCGSEDGFQFECIFKNPKNVEWFMNQDWIVDYDKYAEMPISDLEVLIEDLDAERFAKIGDFNAKDEVYRKKYYAEISEEFSKSGHKIISLEYLLDARKGKIKFIFPDNSKYRTAKEKNSNLFKRLFSHSAQ